MALSPIFKGLIFAFFGEWIRWIASRLPKIRVRLS